MPSGAPGLALDPSFRVHVAAEFARDAAIMKERRKAREARDPRAGGGGGKKDKGKKGE